MIAPSAMRMHPHRRVEHFRGRHAPRLTLQELKDAAAKHEEQHPLDEQYESLGTRLALLDSSAADYEPVQRYFQATAGSGRNVKLQHIWAVDSADQAAAFAPSAKLSNHKLLWHGTNVAVVAAILSGGLRIMPHSRARHLWLSLSLRTVHLRQFDCHCLWQQHVRPGQACGTNTQL